ncbi:hypothetical protein [uncultured Veillonella sp.]|uniref:hypothetical protein n=1 Tax=uncultured Veillonella sp. TaxID=159268 RepID=UPI00266F5544|nr:hypothetical protein [uncultured Veillonella sp.]
MKFKTFMPVLALACICAVGQADAAQDRLMMPEQPAEPLNVIEAEVVIPVPSEEVRDVVNAFTQFQLDQKGKYIMDDSRVMKGQERYRNNVLYYMNVRRSWYIVSHRYKKDSYARMALDRLYNDYKEFFMDRVTVSDDEKLDYAQQIIDILNRNTANVHDDELRFYMNEMVIFSLKEAMKDGNNRVKPAEEEDIPKMMEEPHTVDLRQAIYAPAIQ